MPNFMSLLHASKLARRSKLLHLLPAGSPHCRCQRLYRTKAVVDPDAPPAPPKVRKSRAVKPPATEDLPALPKVRRSRAVKVKSPSSEDDSAPSKLGRPAHATEEYKAGSLPKLPFGELPPPEEWRKYFPLSFGVGGQRVSLSNAETAAKVAESFVPAGSKDKVIIEAFPGPGLLTRALLALPKERIQKIIVLEHHAPYLEYLKPLEEIDPRVTVLSLSPASWDSYQELSKMGLLDQIPICDFDQVHPNLHFVSHLPSNLFGEQLIAQYFRLLPDRQWLFKYGRVPMSLVMSDYVWQRIRPPTIGGKCKLTAIAEAVAECDLAIPYEDTQPFEDHFYPVPVRSSEKLTKTGVKVANRRVGNPFLAMTAIPHEKQLIEPGLIEKWDYCLRRLFVKKATPLDSSITALGPGAKILKKSISDPTLDPSERIDLDKKVQELTILQWRTLVKAFDEWPFAPENLDIGFMTEKNRH